METSSSVTAARINKSTERFVIETFMLVFQALAAVIWIWEVIFTKNCELLIVFIRKTIIVASKMKNYNFLIKKYA